MKARIVEILVCVAIVAILAAFVHAMVKERNECEAKGGAFVRTYSGGGACFKAGTVIQY